MAAVASPAPQLTYGDLPQVQPSLQAYLDRFRSLFPRCDQAASFGTYNEGVLSDERRKSVKHLVRPTVSGTPSAGGGGCAGHARGRLPAERLHPQLRTGGNVAATPHPVSG